MSSRMRIVAKASLAKLPKNIILSAKGVNRVVGANGEMYDRCPIENYHHQDVQPSTVDSNNENFVDVFAGKSSTGTLKPELGQGGGGVFQVVLKADGSPQTQTSPEGVTLWLLHPVETVRNEKV